MKQSRKNNLSESESELALLVDEGHEVVRHTDIHWKIDGIDVWPTTKKYMKNGNVRIYQSLRDIFEIQE